MMIGCSGRLAGKMAVNGMPFDFSLSNHRSPTFESSVKSTFNVTMLCFLTKSNVSDVLRANRSTVMHVAHQSAVKSIRTVRPSLNIASSSRSSVKSFQGSWIGFFKFQPKAQITERILEAIEHPYTSAIAHPTGRLIGRRKPYEVDLGTVIGKAVEKNKLLELNANPARLDLDDIGCAAVKAQSGMVVIATDAHKTVGLDCMRYGVLQARRGGLTKGDVANTQNWSKLRKWIGRSDG
jgi:histidinol phosphatase-like PHP family hydrolase